MNNEQVKLVIKAQLSTQSYSLLKYYYGYDLSAISAEVFATQKQ